MKGLLTLLVLGAISAGIFALGSLHRDGEDKPLIHVAEELPLDVEVATPERREVIRLVQSPGDVEAVLEVEISSEIVAKIEQMPIEEGDEVAKGDLLCRLDDDQLLAMVESGQARVARAKAAVMSAEAEFEKADRDLTRQIRLSEHNISSANELAEYRIAHKRANANLAMREQDLVEAEAFLKQANEDLQRTTIVSPINGIISRLNAKEGEVVITGTMNNPGTVIMSISDLSQMQVRARVDEIDAPLVNAGQKARIYLQSDQNKPVPGEVVRVAAKGSKQLGRDVVTFETIISVLSDDPRIKPGMTANVEIEVAKQADAVTVPVEAVVHRLRKELAEDIVEEYDRRQNQLDLSDRARQAQYIKVIYVMEDEQARLRLIDTGIADSRRVEIKAGVEPDDTVIIGPYRSLDQLKDGRKVAKIEEQKKEGLSEDGDEPEQQATAQTGPQDDDEKSDG